MPTLMWFAVPNLFALFTCKQMATITLSNGTRFTSRLEDSRDSINANNALIEKKRKELGVIGNLQSYYGDEYEASKLRLHEILDWYSPAGKSGNALELAKTIIKEATWIEQTGADAQQKVQQLYDAIVRDANASIAEHMQDVQTYWECSWMISRPQQPPGEILPDATEVAHFDSAKSSQRRNYFLSLMVWVIFTSTCLALLLVMISGCVLPEAQLLYQGFCISLSAIAAANGWVSKQTGFDWELWVVWLSTVDFSMLLSLTVHLARLPKGQRRPTFGEIIKGCTLPFMPILSELIDTQQDWLLAAMCFQQGGLVGWSLGVLSVLIMVFSNYVLRHMPGGPRFLLGAYFPLLEVKRQEKKQQSAATDLEESKASGTSFKALVLKQLEEMASLEKLMIAVTEDVPQAVIKGLMAYFLGGHGWVMLSIYLQVGKLILSFVLPPLMKMVQGRSVQIQLMLQHSAQALYFALLIPFIGEDSIQEKLRAQSNLAASSKKLGELQQAKDLEEVLLEEHTRLYRRDHDLTLEVMSSLADTLFKLGKLDDSMGEGLLTEAKVLRDELLELLRRKGKHDDPKTVQTEVELGVTCGQLGDSQRSKELLRKARAHSNMLLGIGLKHDSTSVEAMFQLALSCNNEEELQKKKQLLQETLEQRRRLLGDKERDTIRAKAQLAVTLHKVGEMPQSKKLLGELFGDRAQLLGDDDGTTEELAAACRDMNELQKSTELLEQTYSHRRQLLEEARAARAGIKKQISKLTPTMLELALTHTAVGNLHDLNSVDAMLKLALYCDEVCNLQQSTAESRSKLQQSRVALLTEIVTQRRRLRGDDDMDCVKAKVELAAACRGIGKLEQANKLFEEALAQWRRLPLRTLDDKKSMVKTMIQLAGTCRDLGQWQRSKDLLSDILQTTIPKLRQESNSEPEKDALDALVQEARAQLAGTLRASAMDGLQELKNFLEGIQKSGEQRADSVQTMIQLAVTNRELGAWQEAKKLFTKVLQQQPS